MNSECVCVNEYVYTKPFFLLGIPTVIKNLINSQPNVCIHSVCHIHSSATLIRTLIPLLIYIIIQLCGNSARHNNMQLQIKSLSKCSRQTSERAQYMISVTWHVCWCQAGSEPIELLGFLHTTVSFTFTSTAFS